MTASLLSPLLGTALPIIQAPMAGVQGSGLAVAVSNAGGLGSLPGAMLGPEGLREELAAMAEGTANAYNVNFFCHVQPTRDDARDARWRELLAPYYRELDVDPATVPAGPARAPFDHDAADVLAPFKPPVVSFHFGLPSRELLDRVRQWRPLILASATTVDEARWLEAHRVDAIIAQGVEAGGHRGMFLSEDLTTQVGTAYMLCPEATTSRVHRDALMSPGAKHTALTNVFTGRPARAIGLRRVVGVVGDIRHVGPEAEWRTQAFVPIAQSPVIGATLVVRTTRGAQDVWTGIRRAIAAEFSGLPLRVDEGTLEGYYGELVAERRFNMLLLTLFGLLGLVIAVVGIYGVMAYVVTHRTKEIGIRMALGAAPAAILRSVLGGALVCVAIGLAIGLLGAWILAGAIGGFLFEIRPHDPTVYAGVVVVLGLAGLTAAALPARRAASADPLIALRME